MLNFFKQKQSNYILSGQLQRNVLLKDYQKYLFDNKLSLIFNKDDLFEFAKSYKSDEDLQDIENDRIYKKALSFTLNNWN